MRTALVLAMFVLATGSAAGDDKPTPKYKGKELDYWIAKLERPADDKEMEEVAEAVKAFGPDAAPALPKLVVMLEDKSPRYSFLVMEIIIGMKSKALRVVPTLVKRLKDKTATDPDAILTILEKLGPAAAEATTTVAGYLDDEQCDVQAIRTLCAFGPEAAKPQVHAILKALRREQHGFESVTKLKGLVVPGLIEWLGEVKDSRITELIVGTLADIGPEAKAAVPALKRLAFSDKELKAIKKQLADLPPTVFPFPENTGLTYFSPKEYTEHKKAQERWEVGFGATAALACIEPAPEYLDVLMLGLADVARYNREAAVKSLHAMGKFAAPALAALAAGEERCHWEDKAMYQDAIAAIKKAVAEK